MLLLFVSLQAKLIKSEWVSHTSRLLLIILPFLFIPTGAGVASYTMPVAIWLKFGAALLILTSLGIVVVGRTASSGSAK